MLPDPYFASEQAPTLAATYAYVLEHPDAGMNHWVKWDKPITMLNLPANLGDDDSQLFTPVQVAHGSINTSERFEPRPVYLQVPSTDEKLRRFFASAAAEVIRLTIIRISAQAIPESMEIDYERHAMIVFSGIASKFNFSGVMIRMEATPEAHFIDRAVPRQFFGRTCNHALFGAGCGLDKEDFAWTTTIAALDPVQRLVTLTGTAPGSAAGHFEAGYFHHGLMGLNVSLAWSVLEGSDTKCKAFTWLPGMEVGDTVTAYPGCRHTTADCKDRFNNSANFGGFAWVPAKNPTTNGV